MTATTCLKEWVIQASPRYATLHGLGFRPLAREIRGTTKWVLMLKEVA